MTFPISGVEVFPAWPFLVALAVSFVTSMGGVSGAFLLLPYQVSALGFTSPGVSSTNLLYNIVAIPGGIYRFAREGRMLWPLVAVLAAGSAPGAFVGAYLRLRYLPDPRAFKLFVGLVLLYVGARLVWDLARGRRERSEDRAVDEGEGRLETVATGLVRASYRWRGETYSYNPMWIFLLTSALGVVGGAYGIGGGSMLAPILLSVFRLPVHTIAGAVLTSTFVTSVVGVVAYIVVGRAVGGDAGDRAGPDWLLGALMGVGGFCGIYLGARLQKRVPAKWIKAMLSLVIAFLSVRYIVGFFV